MAYVNTITDLLEMAGARHSTAGILTTSPYKPYKRINLCTCPYCSSPSFLGKVPESTLAELSTNYNNKCQWKIEGYAWLLYQLSFVDLPYNFVLKFPETMTWEKGLPKLILKPLGPNITASHKGPMSKDFAWTHFGSEVKPHLKEIEAALNQRKRLSFSRTDTQKYKAVIKMRTVTEKPEYENLSPQEALYVTEKVLMEVFVKWPLDKAKSIISIHTAIKPKSPGVSVRVHYFANESNKFTAKYRSLEPHVEQCKELCKNMCKAIAEYTDFEILEMVAEFCVTKEEIWLSDAWRIVYWNAREEKNRKIKETNSKNMQAKAALKQGLLNRMENKANSGKKVSYIKELTQIMRNTIDTLKDDINDDLDKDLIVDYSDNAFAKLRPNSKLRFHEFLAHAKLHKVPLPKGKVSMRN